MRSDDRADCVDHRDACSEQATGRIARSRTMSRRSLGTQNRSVHVDGASYRLLHRIARCEEETETVAERTRRTAEWKRTIADGIGTEARAIENFTEDRRTSAELIRTHQCTIATRRCTSATQRLVIVRLVDSQPT